MNNQFKDYKKFKGQDIKIVDADGNRYMLADVLLWHADICQSICRIKEIYPKNSEIQKEKLKQYIGNVTHNEELGEEGENNLNYDLDFLDKV